MQTFLWHPLTPKCTWPSQNKSKKTLRKYWENFFRNYAPFYIQGGGIITEMTVLGYLDLVDGIFMHLDLHDGVGEEKEESKGKDGKKDPRDGWPTLPPEFMETTTIQPEKYAI